jgi:hypothetical protein
MISLPILDELKNLGFEGTRRNPLNRRGQSYGFTPRLEIDDEAHPRTQIHGRNRRKTHPNLRMKNRTKILQKSQKRKMIHTTWR